VDGNYNRKGCSKNSGDGLETAVKLWPTPKAGDADHGGPNSRYGRGNYSLSGAVHHPDLWATPTANDVKNSLTESQRGRGTLTAHIVESLWTTPRTKGMCGGTGNWQQLKKKCAGIEEARKMGACNGGQLNPDWVCALMGYPHGWENIDADAVDMESRYPAAWLDGTWEEGIPRTISGVKNRVSRLKCLGNAVVPQIPALIWRMIKERL
jgi:hypothetical protein